MQEHNRIKEAKDKLLKDREELFAQAQDLGKMLSLANLKVEEAENEAGEIEAHYKSLQKRIEEIDLTIKFCEGFLS